MKKNTLKIASKIASKRIPEKDTGGGREKVVVVVEGRRRAAGEGRCRAAVSFWGGLLGRAALVGTVVQRRGTGVLECAVSAVGGNTAGDRGVQTR